MASKLAKRGVQPVSRRMRADEATSTAGSPGRRGPMACGTGRPSTRSTVVITSCTE